MFMHQIFSLQLVKRAIAELAHARNTNDVLEERCMGMARERDHLVRTIDSLKASLDEAR